MWKVDERMTLQATGEERRVRSDELKTIVVRTTGEKEEESHRLVSRDLASAAHAMPEVGIRGGRELTRREPVALSKLSVKRVKVQRAATRFEMPRTFAEGGKLQALAKRMPGGYTQAVALCFERAKNAALPRHLREVGYKVLVSGFPIGTKKMATKEKPEEGLCVTTGEEETVAHVFAESPTARSLWRRVLRAWRVAVGEDLRRAWKTAALLGHRESGDRAELEEPFAILRAIVLNTLWKERCTVRNGTEAHTVEQLHDTVKRHLLDAADGRRTQVHRLTEKADPSTHEGNKNSIGQFYKVWVNSGLLKTVTGARALSVLLRYK